MMKYNAIILAAGSTNDRVSNDFDLPKSLYLVNGEPLIERQIKQLLQANISDITIVVGNKKEYLLYLEEKYDVNFIINKDYLNKGNLYSLYLTKHLLKNTFVCFCDNYFKENLFLNHNEDNGAYRICCLRNNSNEFYVDCLEDNTIKEIKAGKLNGLCMTGFAFFNESFSNKFNQLLEEKISNLGYSKLFWEDFVQKNIASLSMKAKIVEPNMVMEFDSLYELNLFNNNSTDVLDPQILRNICSVFNCEQEQVKNINILSKGLTNVSFTFEINGNVYIYRHPGNTSSKFVNRDAECHAEFVAKSLGVDNTFITMDVNSGWKISEFIPSCVDFDYKNDEQLTKAVHLLKKLHDSKSISPINFDPYYEADRLLNLASKGNNKFLDLFKELNFKMRKVYLYTELDGVPKVLCHNDAYGVNFLVGNNSFNIIDWEYSGNNDPIYDLGCIIVRDELDDALINKILQIYLNHVPDHNELRHIYGIFALAGWYWFCWSLCKNSIGDDFGWYYLRSYHSAKKYCDLALRMYEEN